MDYLKWSKQYLKEAQMVKNHIKKVREELKYARSKKQATDIYYRIASLYQIYYELKETSRKVARYAQEVESE